MLPFIDIHSGTSAIDTHDQRNLCLHSKILVTFGFPSDRPETEFVFQAYSLVSCPENWKAKELQLLIYWHLFIYLLTAIDLLTYKDFSMESAIQ